MNMINYNNDITVGVQLVVYLSSRIKIINENEIILNLYKFMLYSLY